MITVTAAQLNAWLAAFAWPFVRILSLIASAPVVGNPSLPASVKIGLALLLSILVVPLLPAPPDVSPASSMGMLILAQQILVGLAMGFAMQLVFHATEMAGEVIGLQMGLGFATLYDYSVPGQIPVIGQFMGIVMSLVFLGINGHLLLISALAESFQHLPVAPLSSRGGFQALADWGGNLFTYSLALSLPLLAALLITNIALGVLSRAAPQLNIFAVGFPATILIGMLMLVLALPYFAPSFVHLWEDGLAAVTQLAFALR